MVEGCISNFLDLLPSGTTLSGSEVPFAVQVSGTKRRENVRSINWMCLKLP
jgi:hypothetical protein